MEEFDLVIKNNDRRTSRDIHPAPSQYNFLL